MQLIPHTLDIRFMRFGRMSLILTLLLMLVCAGALVFKGLNYGLDFTGGTVIEVRYAQAIEMPQVRSALAAGGFADAQTQYIGSAAEVLIRVPPHEGSDAAALSTHILDALKLGNDGAVEVRRVEFVGPQVGGELVQNGSLAAVFAMLGILVYVAFRFEWRLALGAIAATLHDVVFCIGVYALFGIEFDLTGLAAILAVIGYSVNDTVVVFDRIRENFRRLRKDSPERVIDISINETLARTIMTSMTTLLAVVVLYVWGGDAIHTFSLIMIVGVLIGTYSSIYVASATALHLGLSREDLLAKVKEEGDARP